MEVNWKREGNERLTPEQRLADIGLTLPTVPAPMANYVPAKRVQDLVYVSGQGPIVDGKPAYKGKVGNDLSTEEGYAAARLCALNALAAVRSVTGSLDAVAEVVHVRGFVSSDPSYYDQPKVVNGVSDLLVEIFGEEGQHARAALASPALPGNIPVEVEVVFRLAHNCCKGGE